MEAKMSVEYGGYTCLMVAVMTDHIDICRLLTDKGAQMEAKDSNGNTPLHFAAANGHLEIVRLLCDRGADIEAHDDDGCRSLHYSAYYGHISVVKELLEVRNAEISARTITGRTALKIAVEKQKKDIANYLALHGGIH
jgi:ankyrin repeat protein